MGDVCLSRQSQECHTQDESEAFHFGFAVVGSCLIVGSSFFFLLAPTDKPNEAAVPLKIEAG